MPETVNTDVAQELSDRNDARHKERWERVAESDVRIGSTARLPRLS
jgi:hypothetical protein